MKFSFTLLKVKNRLGGREEHGNQKCPAMQSHAAEQKEVQSYKCFSNAAGMFDSMFGLSLMS